MQNAKEEEKSPLGVRLSDSTVPNGEWASQPQTGPPICATFAPRGNGCVSPDETRKTMFERRVKNSRCNFVETPPSFETHTNVMTKRTMMLTYRIFFPKIKIIFRDRTGRRFLFRVTQWHLLEQAREKCLDFLDFPRVSLNWLWIWILRPLKPRYKAKT